MAKISEGDRVQILKRDASVEDARQNRYYGFFGGLVGTVQKLYGTEAAVQVEIDSLPEAIQTRHQASEKRMHDRWLNNLSEEARSKLTPEEQAFHLNYTLLVGVSDLAPMKGDKPAKSAPAPEPAPAAKATASKKSAPVETERATTADLDAAEEAFLNQRKKKG